MQLATLCDHNLAGADRGVINSHPQMCPFDTRRVAVPQRNSLFLFHQRLKKGWRKWIQQLIVKKQMSSFMRTLPLLVGVLYLHFEAGWK